MAAQWYYSIDGTQQQGPITNEELARLARSGQLKPTSQVWKEGMAEWVDARKVKGLFTDLSHSSPGVKKTSQVKAHAAADTAVTPPGFDPANSKRTTAGILALLLGAYGIHKFYLGLKQPAIIQLILGVLCCGIITGPIALIEAIMYFTKSDEAFYQTYIVDKKGWF